MEKKTPLLSVRPEFNQTLTALECLPVAIVGAFMATLICGTFLLVIISFIGLGAIISGGMIFFTLLALSLAAIPPLFYEIKRQAYRKTIYNFHDDYLEFQNFRFHFNKNRGRVRYADIVNVAQRANVLQGRLGLATIYLYVPGMMQSGRAFSGIIMRDIPDNAKAGSRIMDLIENKTA